MSQIATSTAPMVVCPHCPPGAPPVPAEVAPRGGHPIAACPRHGRTTADPGRAAKVPVPVHRTGGMPIPPAAHEAATVPAGMQPIGMLAPNTYVECQCGCGKPAIVLGAVPNGFTRAECNFGVKTYADHELVRVLAEFEWPAERPDCRPIHARGARP